MKSLIKPLRDIGFLTIALTLALAANFAYGQWANPPAKAPEQNVAAPINTGTAAQVKDGTLAVNSLSVFGTGFIESNAPTLKFSDINSGDFWWHANGGSMFLLADRNEDGSWGGESPWPLQLSAGATASEDYLRVSNQVRANEYCDRNGGNCFSAAGGGAGGGGSLNGYVNTCGDGEYGSSACTVSCNAGDIRTGCSAWDSSGNAQDSQSESQPYGVNGCRGPWEPYTTTYAYCVTTSSMCSVEIVSEIRNNTNNNVLASDSRVVAMPEGAVPRVGGVVECGTLPDERYSEQTAEFTPASPNNQPTSLGYWTEAQYTANETYINSFSWKQARPLTVSAGQSRTATLTNGCGAQQTETGTITATVVSCN